MDLLEKNDLASSQTAIEIDPSESLNSEFNFSDDLFDEYNNEEHRVERARRKRGIFSLIVSATAGIVRVVKAGKKAHDLIKKSKRVKRAIERGKELYKEGKEIYDQGKAAYERGKEKLDKGKKRYHEIKDKINGELDYWNGTVQGVKGEWKEWKEKGECIGGKLKADADAIADKFTGKKSKETNWCGKDEDEEEEVDESGQPIVGDGYDQMASDVGEILDIVQQNNELLQQNSENINRNYDAIQQNGENIDRNYEEIKQNGVKLERNFEAIQNNSKLIDRNYEAIKGVEYTMNKNFEVQLQRFGQIQRSMDEAFDTLQGVKGEIVDRIAQAEDEILKRIKEVAVKPLYDFLDDFYNMFILESNEVRSVSLDKRIPKLENEFGIMHKLQDAKMSDKMPYVALMGIINGNYAIPTDKNDQMAFSMLEELCYGMQMYTLIIYFMLEQYGILAENYYYKSNIVKYNHYYELSYNTFKGFTKILLAQNQLLDRVTEVVVTVKELDFVKRDKQDIVNFCEESLKNLAGIRDELTKLDKNFEPDRPTRLGQGSLDFSDSQVQIPNKFTKQWKPDTEVSYAVQFVGEDSAVSSFISDWSKGYELDKQAHPLVHLPADSQGRSRSIFRKFQSEEPQLVAVIKDSRVTSFVDINRDLFDAASQPNKDKALERVQFFVTNGADVNAQFEHDQRPIHAAAENGIWSIADILIQNGSDINVQDDNGYTAIYIVTESGQSEFVHNLVQLGADVNLKIGKELFELSPLHCASYKGFGQIVRSLLNSSSVDVNARTTKGETPLHYAASFCKDDIVELLIQDNRTEINPVNVQQFTPLHLASINNCDKVVHKLSDQKALNVSAATDQHVTPLHLAATYGSADVAQQLVNLGADANAKTDQGASVLHHAAFGGNAETVSIVAKLANPNVVNDLERPPLYLACQFGHLEAAEKLLDSCANINLPLSKSRTMLHLAAINGDHMAAVNLIKLKISLSATDDYGRTALHYAVAYNYLSIAYALLEAGADPNIRDSDNVQLIYLTSFLEESSALNMIKLLADYGTNFEAAIYINDGWEKLLQIFCKMNYPKVVEFLLVNKKVDVNAISSSIITPLHFASELGHSEIVQLLVEHEANVNVRAAYDETPLHFAVRNGHFKVVQILVEKGTDVNAKEQSGVTPLHYAAQIGDFEMLQLLVKEGADVNAMATHDETPLHYAIKSDHFEIVKHLIEKGADVNAKGQYDTTPLHYVGYWHGSVEVADHLLKNGADMNIKSPDGDTVVHNAFKGKNFEVARYLIDNGGEYKSSNNVGMSSFLSAIENGADVEFAKYLASKEGVDVHEVKVDERYSVIHREGGDGGFVIVDVMNFVINKRIHEVKEVHEEKVYNRYNAIHYAVVGDGDVQLVKFLIEELGIKLADNVYVNDKTLIVHAIDKNKAEMVKYLLGKGADHRTEAPLRIAAKNGQNEIVKHLLDNDPKQFEYDENSSWLIIWISIEDGGDLRTVKYLVEAGSDTSFSDKYNYNLLHLSADLGKLDVVKYLAEERGVDWNSRIDSDAAGKREGWGGRLPLHTAARTNRSEVVQYLVNKTVENVDATDDSGRSVLDYALFDAKNWDMAKFLLSKGADINQFKTDRFEEYISDAIKEGKYDMAKYLLANSNYGPNMTKSPLHFAVEMDDIEFVYYLLGKGADYNKKDVDGKTPIDLMIDERKYDTIKFFIFHYKDQDGTTVLHHKAGQYDYDRVKFLLERGANVNAQNSDGDTPVHFSVRYGTLEVSNLLAHHSCVDISIKNSKGQTAPDVAQSAYYTDHMLGEVRRRRYVHEFDTEKPVKSSAVRPSWWIADAIGMMLRGFKTLAEDVSQFLSKSNLAQSPPQMPKFNSLVLDQNFDVNGTILLLDLLVRSKTGQKYLSFGAQSAITPVKARTYALNLIDKFESLLNKSCNDQLSVKQFDSFKLFQTIESYAISEQFDKIEQTLNSLALETFDRIDSKLLARQIGRLLIETQLEGSQSQQICNSKFSISTKSNIDRNSNYIGFEKHELI